MDKEDATKLQESVDTIAKTTAHILENMATKQELSETRKELSETRYSVSSLQTQVNGIETDLKSFKNDTREEFKKINEKLDDMADTHTNFDSRITKLEEKVFA